MKDKPTGAQARVLAQLAREGARLHGGDFRDRRYWIRTPGIDAHEIVNIQTVDALHTRGWIDTTDERPHALQQVISQKGLEALVDVTLGEAAGARFSIMYQRAATLQQLAASLIQTRGRAGRAAVVFVDEKPESILRHVEAQSTTNEAYVVELLQEHFKDMRATLDDAMRTLGIFPAPKKVEAQL